MYALAAGSASSLPKRLYIAIAFLCMLFLVYRSSSFTLNGLIGTSRPKYAFASLLTSTVSGPNTTAADDQTDVYFISARLLTYQLLHAPETRSTTHVPFLVLVSPDVPERQRLRPAKDGATIVPIDFLREDWIIPSWPQWRDVMSKLRILELVEYDKILLLDLDTIVCKPLDGIFQDPVTEPPQTILNSTEVKTDEAALPFTYSIAGVRNLHEEHTFPPSLNKGDFQYADYFNAGFFVVKPSIELFNYYVSILKLSGRFDPGLPEQSMLNYAHRFTGAMPWKPLDVKWNINYPLYNDYKRGAMSLQEKWWSPPRPWEFEKLFLSWRWRMEGYFQAMDAYN